MLRGRTALTCADNDTGESPPKGPEAFDTRYSDHGVGNARVHGRRRRIDDLHPRLTIVSEPPCGQRPRTTCKWRTFSRSTGYMTECSCGTVSVSPTAATASREDGIQQCLQRHRRACWPRARSLAAAIHSWSVGQQGHPQSLWSCQARGVVLVFDFFRSCAPMGGH